MSSLLLQHIRYIIIVINVISPFIIEIKEESRSYLITLHGTFPLKTKELTTNLLNRELHELIS